MILHFCRLYSNVFMMLSPDSACMLLFYEGRWRRLTSKTTSSTTINEYCCTLSVFFYISRRNTKKMLVHVIKCYSLSCKGEFAMTGLPNLYLILKFLINSRPLDGTCSWRCNGLELCTRRISCFFAFSFPGNPIATFTLQMFFSFDSLSITVVH